MFNLRFPETDVVHWAERYSYPVDDNVENKIAPQARERGYLTRAEFVDVCRWKTPRTQALVRENPFDLIEAATRAALESRHEEVKIGVLRLLRGVAWPTATVILHFCDKRPYPVLDVRALWSLGYKKPPAYTLEFWLAYTEFTRKLARQTGQSMRIIDRALWQYSRESQPTSAQSV